MDWIKRNLFFVIGASIALLLMIGAGLYTWSGWSHNSKALEELNAKYEELKQLMNANPSPGSDKVNNIETAKEQQKTVQGVFSDVAKQFERITPIPEGTNVSVQDFATTLSKTIAGMQRDAASVGLALLQPKYEFSFKQQNQAFKISNVGPLAVQLGEVRALFDILVAAKVNALEGIQRERVSQEDMAGQATDYIDIRSETNELAILTPYQITFRSFTPELAQVLCGFATSPNGFIVKSINVEPAPATAEAVNPAAAVAPVYSPAPAAAPPVASGKAAEDRYAIRPTTPIPQPQPTYAPAAAAASSAPKTVLNEKQLKITMLVQIVKLQPKPKK